MNNKTNNYKLPIKEIFFDAISLPMRHFKSILKFGSPLIIVFILSVIIAISLGNVSAMKPYATFTSLLLSLIVVASLVMAIVGLHRTFLMNENDIRQTRLIRWSGREMRFVGWWALIGLCALLIIMPFFLILGTKFIDLVSGSGNFLPIVLVAMNIPIVYLVSRWSLVLPATAIDIRNRTLIWSWGLSKGNGWRLTFLIGVLPLLVDVLFKYVPKLDSIFFYFVVIFVWFVVAIIEIGLLSLSYKYLSENINMAPLN